jgi:hypothetical protein
MRNTPAFRVKRNTLPHCVFRKILLLSVVCQTGVLAHAQWQSGANMYNLNTGNVGIGTTTPHFLLDVNGGFSVSGQNCNLDPAATFSANLVNLENTGKLLIGWNRVSGNGESDLIANSGPGTPGGIAFWNYTNAGVLSPLMYLGGQGNIGINTSTPAYPLDVYGGWACMRVGLMAKAATPGAIAGWFQGPASGDANVVLQGGGGNDAAYWITGTSGLLMIGGNGANEPTGALNINGQGNVLIGKTAQTNSTYKLDVSGNGRLNEVVVNTTGADFVFDSSYHLSSLPELNNYIWLHHHLPGIASARQMQEQGVALGVNQTQLLAKVEELTLYLIQQDKENAALKERIRQLEERSRILENLEQRIQRLEYPEKPADSF